VVTNAQLVQAVPGWPAERIEEKTGITARRYFWPFDEQTGHVQAPDVVSDPGPCVQLAEAALLQALARAGLAADELDGIVLTTCTPDKTNFSHDAMILHQRLGLRPEAFALVHDDGCGGALFHVAMVREMMMGSQRRHVAVIGVNAMSPLIDRDVYTRERSHQGRTLGAYLTPYLFGDGAGAIILSQSDDQTSRFVASYAANRHADLVIRDSGGGMFPVNSRGVYSDPAFYVDGKLVAECFAPFLSEAIEGALSRAGVTIDQIDRFYLHQANKRVLEKFIADRGIPRDRVGMHMERYGNITTAGTLVLLAEELGEGIVALGSGQLILMAAIGAGSQCAAHVIRL
jgi:3-oxoacyl-[acyl-carrier-protein] synthase III